MPYNNLLTWAQAKDEVKRRLGNRSDLGNRLDTWLGSAQSVLAHTSLSHPYLDEVIDTFRLTDGIAEYDLTAMSPPLGDIVGFKYFYDSTTGYQLTRFPYHEWRSLTDQSEGDPMRWSRDGHRLVFDPKPDASRYIRVEYRREPTSGVVEVENQWQETLVRLATAIGHSALDESSRERAILGSLPVIIQAAYNKPLNQDQWESIWDPNLRFGPPLT